MTKRSGNRFDDRKREIFATIVKDHIATGQPVGSFALAKQSRENLSSATIRNICAELEDEGYLTHPHTSAGRLPTDRGYRFYVDNFIGSTKLSRSDAARINERLLDEQDNVGRMAAVEVKTPPPPPTTCNDVKRGTTGDDDLDGTAGAEKIVDMNPETEFPESSRMPMSGRAARICSAARIPSSPWPGGIRMSVSTTSGTCAGSTPRATAAPSPPARRRSWRPGFPVAR